jgi:hypothetical protein
MVWDAYGQELSTHTDKQSVCWDNHKHAHNGDGHSAVPCTHVCGAFRNALALAWLGSQGSTLAASMVWDTYARNCSHTLASIAFTTPRTLPCCWTRRCHRPENMNCRQNIQNTAIVTASHQVYHFRNYCGIIKICFQTMIPMWQRSCGTTMARGLFDFSTFCFRLFNATCEALLF